MGSFQIWHRNKHVFSIPFLLSIILILVTSSIVEDRGIHGSLMEEQRMSWTTTVSVTAEEAEMMMVRSNQIGSRPPSCRRKCRECGGGGHCEAVQVPVMALHDSSSHQNQRKRRHFLIDSKHNVGLTSEDETSNYKPISWKCKCGNFIFNP